MKKKKLLTSLFLGLGLLTAITSCRESFDENFPDVEILNNAPSLTGEIDTVSLTLGFSESTLDLAAYVVDAEDDPLTVAATSSDESIVKVTANGAILTFEEGGSMGVATISATLTDGNEGNEISFDFPVKVSDVAGPTFAYGFDFTLPNGTTNDDIEWPDGATVEFSSGSGGVTRTIQNGASFWDLPAQGDLLLSLTLDEPVDISDNPTFQLDYADSKNSILYLEFYDASGGFASVEPELITDDPDFNTLMIDLSAFSGDLDLTQISGMALEKYIDWESDEVDNGTSWIIDNFYLGYQAGAGDTGPVYDFDFTLANGTTGDDITWPAGALVEFSSGSGGVTRTIQNGASFWDLPAEGDLLLSLTLDAPADISDNPTFQLDYADSKNSILYLEFYDASGGFVSVEPELITDDPEFNTLTVDLSAFSEDLDLTQFSGMALEKYIDWESDEVENGTSWIIDNFIIGPNN